MSNPISEDKPPVVFSLDLNRRTLVFALLGVLAMTGLFFFMRKTAHYVPRKALWAEVEAQAPQRGLDPAFVFNLAMAESSLNAHAQTNVARGLMQITQAVWGDVTDRPYEEAYNWRINLEVAMDHLEILKQRLERQQRYNTARLAAAYHRGYTALARKKFDVSKLPRTNNEIYQRLFAGEIPPMKEYGL